MLHHLLRIVYIRCKNETVRAMGFLRKCTHNSAYSVRFCGLNPVHLYCCGTSVIIVWYNTMSTYLRLPLVEKHNYVLSSSLWTLRTRLKAKIYTTASCNKSSSFFAPLKSLNFSTVFHTISRNNNFWCERVKNKS